MGTRARIECAHSLRDNADLAARFGQVRRGLEQVWGVGFTGSGLHGQLEKPHPNISMDGAFTQCQPESRLEERLDVPGTLTQNPRCVPG
jgi:hypothetical protein